MVTYELLELEASKCEVRSKRSGYLEVINSPCGSKLSKKYLKAPGRITYGQ